MKRITIWNEINWKRCSIELKILQNKLAIASSNGVYDQTCKQLQAQIVKSFAARALAVKSVVSKGGKKSPGVDNVIWDSAHKKAKAIEQLLNTANYKAPCKTCRNTQKRNRRYETSRNINYVR